MCVRSVQGGSGDLKKRRIGEFERRLMPAGGLGGQGDNDNDNNLERRRNDYLQRRLLATCLRKHGGIRGWTWVVNRETRLM